MTTAFVKCSRCDKYFTDSGNPALYNNALSKHETYYHPKCDICNKYIKFDIDNNTIVDDIRYLSYVQQTHHREHFHANICIKCGEIKCEKTNYDCGVKHRRTRHNTVQPQKGTNDHNTE
jgi:hypothetical protein